MTFSCCLEQNSRPRICVGSGANGQGNACHKCYCLESESLDSSPGSPLCYVLSCSVISDSLQPYGLKPARLLFPWGFSRREYWSGLPYSRGSSQYSDLPNTGIEPRSPTLQADSLLSELPRKPGIQVLVHLFRFYWSWISQRTSLISSSVFFLPAKSHAGTRMKSQR